MAKKCLFRTTFLSKNHCLLFLVYPRDMKTFNPLSINPTKWSNTLRQLVGFCRQIIWVYLTILWGWNHFVRKSISVHGMEMRLILTLHLFLKIIRFMLFSISYDSNWGLWMLLQNKVPYVMSKDWFLHKVTRKEWSATSNYRNKWKTATRWRMLIPITYL